MWEHLLPILFSWQAALAAALLIPFAFLARHLQHNNPREEPLAGIALLGMRLYAHLFHRLRIEGIENIPPRRGHGPLVLVANHTAGVDPILIQSVVPFEVRFLMARDMQPRFLRELWEWTGVIAVNRDGPDSRAAREAIRWLRHGGLDGAGGCIGIFPEGGIERPPHRVLPFLAGIGFIVQKSGARVLPVVIDGTPYAATAWGSLLRRSRSRLRVLPPITYTDTRPADVAADLRQRFLDATGWPPNDSPRRELTQA